MTFMRNPKGFPPSAKTLRLQKDGAVQDGSILVYCLLISLSFHDYFAFSPYLDAGVGDECTQSHAPYQSGEEEGHSTRLPLRLRAASRGQARPDSAAMSAASAAVRAAPTRQARGGKR